MVDLDEYGIAIYPNCQNGFNLALRFDFEEDNYKINFNEWSRRFENSEEDEDELGDLIIAALVGTARIKEVFKGGRSYRWELQVQGKNNLWVHYSTTAIATLDFWSKKSELYLINDCLS